MKTSRSCGNTQLFFLTGVSKIPADMSVFLLVIHGFIHSFTHSENVEYKKHLLDTMEEGQNIKNTEIQTVAIRISFPKSGDTPLVL